MHANLRPRGGTAAVALVCLAAGLLSLGFGLPAAASAKPAAHCGYLNGHGLSIRLPLRAIGVSCRRARKLAAAWQRRARSGTRSSPCIPDQGGAPHKSCLVQGWKCTAGQSPDGATIPVVCKRHRNRVQFKSPV